MRRSKGAAAIIATVITLAALALLLVFFWRVVVYYRAIKSGDTSKLPQFSSQLTFSPDAAEVGGPNSIERANLETADDPSLGPEDARLVIVEFIDYECLFCQQASGIVRSLAAKYSDQVRFIVRDFPVLELHPNALSVTEAMGCAEEQGKYWQMHDRIFSEVQVRAPDALVKLAEQSGVDAKEYAECMKSDRRLDEIGQDVLAGQVAGIRGTPTFFFNGRRVEGMVPEDVFESLIQGFLGN